MTERAVNDRRNWKAQTFPYDHFIPDDSKECCYCLTDKQAEILRGIVEPLAWHTRWWSDTEATIDRDAIEAFRDDLIRRLMMSCCDDGTTLYRYNDDGVYQQSTDGGLMWEDIPDYTETSIVWQDPNSMGISTSKCQAADGVVQTFKTQVTEQIADDMGYAAIVGVIVAVLLLFLSAGTTAAITAQIAALVGLIFGTGVAAWKAAMTTGVWDQFRCMVLCHMDSNSSIDAEGLADLISDIDTNITGIAAPTLHGYVKAAGVVGLTNMMRSGAGSVDADCTDCDCPVCDPSGWTNGLYYSGSNHPSRGGTIIETGVDYVIIQSADRGDGQQEINFRSVDLLTCCDIAFEWVGSTPGHSLDYRTDCGVQGTLENAIGNSMNPVSCTSLYFQIDPGSWQMKFTFI